MGKSRFEKVKNLAILLLMLSSALITLSFLPTVKAQTTIISITPSWGYVETAVQLNGSVTTFNGRYTVKFDQTNMTSGNATEHEVNATFLVPNTIAGNHTVMLFDEATGDNATITFDVLTHYSLKMLPEINPPTQRQEGDQVQILLNITGGEQNKPYVANITVQAPNNASRPCMLSVVTSDIGNSTGTVNYPDNFTDANTSFVGTYHVFCNTTTTPATETFFIGLTNSTQYHRFEVVDIKAVYTSSESVNITIEGKDLNYSDIWPADLNGTISYTLWSVPSNASIGTYMVNITSISGPTTKRPPDIQNFTVPGLAINVTSRNLAGEPVSNVTIRVFENATSVGNSTSDLDGLAYLRLEVGNYTSEAYFRDQKIGERWLNVTKDVTSFDFECNLTNLRILVTAIVEEAEIYIPEVGIWLAPENQTATTNITGTAVFHSLLPNVTYTLNLSRYAVDFDVKTIQTLLVDNAAIAWFNVSITCPTLTLQINVTNPNLNNQPIINVQVKVQELMGGISYENRTDSDGTVIFNPIFGKYDVEVYDENRIKLNETTVELFENKNISISCSLYGLTVYVKVVDYFGQPIPNAKVKLQRERLAPQSRSTQSNGTATFTSITGGNLQISVYLNDQTQPSLATSLFVDRPTTIEIKIEKYVMFLGFLVETGQFITAIIVAIVIILLLSIEVYRRKRLKPRRSES